MAAPTAGKKALELAEAAVATEAAAEGVQNVAPARKKALELAAKESNGGQGNGDTKTNSSGR